MLQRAHRLLACEGRVVPYVALRRAKAVLRGEQVTTETPEELRLYRIVRATGWTVDQVDAASSDLCDWLIVLHEADLDVAADRQAMSFATVMGVV